jgi:hypothetical protein
MRNGFLHFYSPKAGLELTEVRDSIEGVVAYRTHPYVQKSGVVVLVVEYLYIDFVDACHKVITKRFRKDHKMSKPFLRTDLLLSK